MPKFNFPMTFDEFSELVGETDGFDVLGGDLEFAFSCLRMGWMNKQYHKDKQGRDQEEMRIIKKRMKEDPEIRAQILGVERSKKI